MRDKLTDDIALLKEMSSETLYQTFHKIQTETLAPQWDSYLQSIAPNFSDENTLKLYGPRYPELPEWYENEILNEISNSKGKEVLFLNHTLVFLSNPVNALILAKKSGFKTLVINESPMDGSFRYKSNPKIKFFENRHELAFTRHGQNLGNKSLEAVLSSLKKTGWTVDSRSNLNFEYKNEDQKRNLVKMELALDLIEHKLSAHPSRFEEIFEELKPWYYNLESQVIVTGCSSWFVLT